MIECLICGARVNILTHTHLAKHGVTLSQYKESYPDAPTRSEDAIARRKEAAKRTNAGRVGVPRSDEVREKIRNTKHNSPSEPWNKGIPMSDEAKQRLSEVKTALYASGELTHWNTGRTMPQHVRTKISATAKASGRTYSEESKAKRAHTMVEKKLSGWVKRSGYAMSAAHHVVLRQYATNHNTQQRQRKVARHVQLMKTNGITVVSYSDDHMRVSLRCGCGAVFTRVMSVLAPFRYDLYDGKYCPSCYPREWGYFSHAFFEKYPDAKDHPGRLYVVRVEMNGETFIKVGITTHSVYHRLRVEPFTYKTLVDIEMPISKAFHIEQHILSQVDRYQPSVKFGGYTECFSEEHLSTILPLVRQQSCHLI